MPARAADLASAPVRCAGCALHAPKTGLVAARVGGVSWSSSNRRLSMLSVGQADDSLDTVGEQLRISRTMGEIGFAVETCG